MKPLTSLTLTLAALSTSALAVDVTSYDKIKITIDYNKNPSQESLVSLQEVLWGLNQEGVTINESTILNQHEIIVDMGQFQKKEVDAFIVNLNELLGDDAKALPVKLDAMKQGTQDWTKLK
jgi:hypothetical protein